MRRFALLLVTAAVLVVVFGADSAMAQATGTTAISVQLNPLAILYYRTSMTLTVSAQELADAVAGANPVNEGAASPALATAAIGELAGDATVGASSYDTSIVTTLSNFYQVRSTRPFTVAVTLPSPTLSAAGSGSITLSTQETRINAGTWGGSAQITGTGITLGTTYAGDVRFTMDVSGVQDITGATTFTGGQIQLALTTP